MGVCRRSPVFREGESGRMYIHIHCIYNRHVHTQREHTHTTAKDGSIVTEPD